MSGRRGACPTLLEPMQTGDGLLARLTPVAGLSGRQLAGLARAAARFGNGIVEITARGSLQVRGLTAESTGGLAAAVDALGIAVRSGLPVETSPLAGLDGEEVGDPRELACAIREGVEAQGLMERLGPKVSVTVDGGGVLGLGGIVADVKLEAVDGISEEAAPYVAPLCPAGHLPLKGGDWLASEPSPNTSHAAPISSISKEEAGTSGRPISPLEGEMSGRTEGGAKRRLTPERSLWLIRVGGSSSTARVLGQFTEPDAAKAAIRILQTLAARGPAARARDLSDAELAAITGREPSPAAGRTASCLPVGRFALAGGRQARGFALAYGQIDSGALARFAENIGETREIRLAPGRGLLILGVSDEEDEALLAGAAQAGLVADGADPRLAIAACAGRPACASAHLATKRLADRLVARRPDLPPGLHVHFSGCAKQCARPAGPVVTLLGGADGHRIVNDGAPVSRDLEALLEELADEDHASMQGQMR